MFLFYVLTFFKKGDIIQGGTLIKGGHYLRKYGSTKLYGFPDIVRFLTDSLEFLTDLLNRISSLTIYLISLKVSYSQNLILILNIDLKTILFWSNCFYVQ